MDRSGPRTFTHENETPGVSGIMASEVDQANGVIRATASGFWSVAQVDAHFAMLALSVRAIQQRGLAVSVIVDLRTAAPAQSQEVSVRLKAGITGIYHTGDRVALVLATSLAKMQMRRIVESEFHDFFLSPVAAERWALAGKRIAPPPRALAS